MTDQEQNQSHPWLGGSIEFARALTFMGQDRDTGSPKEVSLPDRIVVTHGRKKVTLDGAMCKAIHDAYEVDVDFREWCEVCK